jgi:TPR repeat protein
MMAPVYSRSGASGNPGAVQYRKAADQGNARAQFNLGVLYANGQGVAQDYAEAARWYRKAADQGHADAQNNLGLLAAKKKH